MSFEILVKIVLFKLQSLSVASRVIYKIIFTVRIFRNFSPEYRSAADAGVDDLQTHYLFNFNLAYIGSGPQETKKT